tara:strand:- start:1271 stop:1855 length:585 start_codon:yes stop_codon:yes gene_type:complete
MNIDKLNKLKAKHAREIANLEAESRFEDVPGYKFMYHGSNDKSLPWVSLKPNSAEEISEILATFPPTQDHFKMEFAGKDTYIVGSPYKISTNSQIRQGLGIDVEIKWETSGVDIHMDIPPHFIESHCRRITRPVTDCEYHYFGGVSMAEIRRMEIPAWSFKGECQPYFGGRYVLKEEGEIENIISELKGGDGEV